MRLTLVCSPILSAVAFGLLSCHPAKPGPGVPRFSGPALGVVGESLAFKVVADDPDEDSVAYKIDWGDTSREVWTAFSPSGQEIKLWRVYSDSDNYAVRAKAKNGKGGESDWSQEHPLQLFGRGPGFPDSLVGRVWTAPYGKGFIRSMVVSPDGQKLFIASSNDRIVYVMRTSDCEVTDSIDVGRMPYVMCLSHDGSRLYVPAGYEESLSVIRVSDNRVLAKIGIGAEPRAVAATPDGGLLYVAAQNNTVIVVRTSDYSVLARIAVDSLPNGIAIAPDGLTAWTSCSSGRSIVIISTTSNLVVSRVPISGGAVSVEFTRDGERVYAGCADGSISIISPHSEEVMATLHCGGGINTVLMTPDGYYAIAANNELPGAPAYRVNDTLQVGSLRCELPIFTIACTPDGNRIFAAVTGEGIYLFARR